MEAFFRQGAQKYRGTLTFMSNLNKDTTELLNVSNCFISKGCTVNLVQS